ncbi:MAG: HEAT repeat domain-containing protein [Phycisphaerales bacterium]
MRQTTRNITSLSSAVLLFACGGALSGVATTAAGASSMTASVVQPASSDREAELVLLRDFIHFVKIARFDVAADLGQQLLDSGLSPEEFVDLVDSSRELGRFEESIAAAMRVPALQPVAAELDKEYRSGKLARARNPEEIARNIELLSGGLRARQLGRTRLMAAGEYAMPQLLDAYLQKDNLALKAQVQRLLVDMGRQTIAPMMAALPGLDPTRQEAVCEVLGLIPYRTSLPVLVDLYQNTTNDGVRKACGRSISRIGGNPSADVAGMYAQLADSYYNEPSELTSFPGEDHQIVWDFNPGLGLVMTPIRTEVFHEAMAMRNAEKSLGMNSEMPETLALWVASNYSRSFDTPAGYDNPLYGDDRRDAEYYGIAVGPEISQLVLRRGIDTRDTPLVRSAIGALAQTAGSRMLWGQAVDGRYPLLESLGYQNRRVQFEAALALGNAQPQESFSGAERVIPLLASAVRDASARYAVVLTGSDRESYDQYRGVLEAQGFTVLPPSDNGLDGLDASIAEVASVDLVVTSLGYDDTLLTIETARTDSKMAVSPVLALMRTDDVEPLRRQYLRDQTVAVRRVEISSANIGASVEQLLMAASGGPIDQAEADMYASRAIAVLRNLAISNNQVLNVLDASTILIDVLEDVGGQKMLLVGQILSYVDRPAAQSAIMDRAMDTNGIERLALLTLVGDSGKRFGNHLNARQIKALVEYAGSSDAELATVAVGSMGALEIQNTDLLGLILTGED